MIVLDTHVLVWWVADPDKISTKAQKLISQALKKQEIIISSISIWEICLLVKMGRLKLTMDIDSWIQKIESLPFIRFIPVDNTIAQKSVFLLGNFPKDPADRIIAATTLQFGGKLITSDQKILKYPHLQAVW